MDDQIKISDLNANTKKFFVVLPLTGIPAGPYTRQKGIWGYQEIMQAFNNDSLPWLPEAKPKGWTVVRDDCYRAPYTCECHYYPKILRTEKG